MQRLTLLFVAVFASLELGQGAVRLEGYNVDPSQVTVSGLSAGGAFATQFHVAFSSEVSGVGVFAGLPYGCGKGGLADASQCMSIPDWFAPIEGLIQFAETQSSSGTIDPISNLRGQKAYVFHGSSDYTVNKGNGVKVQQFYDHFGSSVATEFSFNANHGHPTDFYGAACSASSAATQYINNCNYNGVHVMFQHLYGSDIIEPNTGTTPAGDLLEFDQSEFITSGTPASISLDSIGFVYIPTGCRDRTRKCRVHIAFHGCVQSRSTSGIGDAFATKTGYTHAAEANNIITIFPQADKMGMTNPNYCFDWWGYLNANFVTKSGAQMVAIQKMLHRVLDCPTCQEEPTTTTSTQAPPTTTRPPGDGSCGSEEVAFRPVNGTCDFYTVCACGGANVLLKCAPGLYFDEKIESCNYMQLVPCEADTKSRHINV